MWIYENQADVISPRLIKPSSVFIYLFSGGCCCLSELSTGQRQNAPKTGHQPLLYESHSDLPLLFLSEPQYDGHQTLMLHLHSTNTKVFEISYLNKYYSQNEILHIL